MSDVAGFSDRALRFFESNVGQRLSIIGYSALATVVLAAFPGSAAAWVFGIPMLFFVPGFAVVRMFFWKDTSLEVKFVLSLGLSVIVVIILGLLLVLTPIGLDSDTTKASLVLFTLGAVAIEMFVVPAEEPRPARPEEKEVRGTQKVDKVVAAMLGTALVVAAVSLGLIVTAEYPSRTYYAVTENGSADIGAARVLGSNMTLTVEMHNGEGGERNFMLLAHGWNTTLYGERWFNKTMADGETWEVNVTFELDHPGIWRFDFVLYIQEGSEEPWVYADPPVHVWIEVS